MKISVQILFEGKQRVPLGEFVAAVANILEQRSFASIWLSEQVVTFVSYRNAFSYPSQYKDLPRRFTLVVRATRRWVVWQNTRRVGSGFA